MAKLNVKPTRGELNRLKERLELASRGHKLLKDKQDELVRQFIVLIKQNNEMRKSVEDKLVGVMQEFALAKAMTNDKMVNEMFSVPTKEVGVYLNTESVMNVRVPKFFIDVSQNTSEQDMGYSYLVSNSGMDDVLVAIESAMQEMLDLAEVEKTAQLMADEIEKTRRRVNGLEYRIIPDLEETIYFIEMKLAENERAMVTRMMKIKDMDD